MIINNDYNDNNKRTVGGSDTTELGLILFE